MHLADATGQPIEQIAKEGHRAEQLEVELALVTQLWMSKHRVYAPSKNSESHYIYITYYNVTGYITGYIVIYNTQSSSYYPLV